MKVYYTPWKSVSKYYLQCDLGVFRQYWDFMYYVNHDKSV